MTPPDRDPPTMAEVKAADAAGEADQAFQLYLHRQLDLAVEVLASNGVELRHPPYEQGIHPVETHIALAAEVGVRQAEALAAGRAIVPVVAAAFDVLTAAADASALYFLREPLSAISTDELAFNVSLMALKAALLGEAGRALAEAVRASKTQARVAKSALSRTGWHAPALALAHTACASNPAISNRELARRIKADAEVKIQQAPGEERILEVVSAWRKAKVIPPRDRQPRHS
jgi:hypothetical protein